MMPPLSQYVIEGALIRPGETAGNPDVPFRAGIGTKHIEDHWGPAPVLEMIGGANALKIFH